MSVSDPIAALPPLRDVIRAAGLSARRSLGQNFLLDLNLSKRIARAAGPLMGVTIIEIGPGPGGLTRALLLEGAARVIAIERDERFRPALAEIAELSRGRFLPLFANALEADYGSIAAESGARRIVGNLPYNIATPLILRWLTQEPWPPWFDKVAVMVQREVAERLIAEPGSKGYGRLSVITQYRTAPKILLTLPATVFTPPPKVASAFVQMVPKPSSKDSVPAAYLEKVTAAAFGKRRKMLRSSLASLGEDTLSLLRGADIDPAERAEKLTVSDFVKLASYLWKREASRNPLISLSLPR
ncbi:MAG TPA: 16S rRNA (adenine(1518)-N(6)/adenine(1519)-N(6))-dimethyltransferase RsmA [Hyphomicrobiales bacterium]|nr:16S rRNA (adenine(1518)-N(6)/adenine(1519)-N(6))-dimethyltransferase RsmA [Hyphomicrobiales bacterium]